MIRNEIYRTEDGVSTLVSYVQIERIDGDIVVTEWNGGEETSRAPTESEINDLEFAESQV